MGIAYIAYWIGEAERRPLRIGKLFRGRPALATYRRSPTSRSIPRRLGDLSTTGWEAAFAATIEQLELAVLRPDDLERLGDPRISDGAT